MNLLIIIFGKLLSRFAKLLNLGHGSTWPGHIALKLNPQFISDLLKESKTKVILVAGTNGKTTTSLMLKTILEKDGKSVLHNASGANLRSGVASYLLFHTDFQGKITHDYAIFESDENTLPHLLKDLVPDYIVILNLFRDQLDRYGEVTMIARKWNDAFEKLSAKTTLVLNADDPLVATLTEKSKSNRVYFAVKNQSKPSMQEHAVDSIYCPHCQTRLTYDAVTFSHLGNWYCPKCNLKRPAPALDIFDIYPLDGTYNKYNTNASVLLALQLGVDKESIKQALKQFQPAFGRQETISYRGKSIQIFLSKNPTGFNESLRTVKEKDAKNVLMLLNDRIPDGRDISWIWDIDFESFVNGFTAITVSGDRVYDLALRLKYATTQNSSVKSQKHNSKFKIYETLSDALSTSLNSLLPNETLYILATYSAMLETRKILTGKKIL